MEKMKKTSLWLFYLILLLLISISITAPCRHRRTVGQRTRGTRILTPFCRMFTHGKVLQKFCLFVKVKHCTALDKWNDVNTNVNRMLQIVFHYFPSWFCSEYQISKRNECVVDERFSRESDLIGFKPSTVLGETM